MRKFKATSPSIRWKKKIFLPNKINYFNKFFKKLKSNAGRSINGKIILKSKGKKYINKYFLYDDKRVFLTNTAVILKIKININNSIIGLLKYSTGIISTIKIPYGSTIGNYVKSTMFPIKLFNATSILGFRVFLYMLTNNIIFFDICNVNKNSVYTKANGTFSHIIKSNIDLNLILILLPSGKKKYVTTDYICTLGRNNNIFKKNIVVGNAGLNRISGKSVTVRGVAMNPVDHPHGGRTKTNKPEVSPWGWVTKHSH